MRSLKIIFLLITQLAIFMHACGDENKKDYVITIHTRYGDMVAVLFDETPKHKKNFVKLAEDGFYDSLIFHRVIADFMIQAGDPNSKGAKAGVMLGNGGPEYTIPAEFIPELIHEKGVLAAARQGDNVNPEKESSGSQFYIVMGKVYTQQELVDSRVDYNQLYRYFGQIIKRENNAAIKEQAIALQKNNNTVELQKLILSLKDEIEKEFNVELDQPLTDLQMKKYTTVGGVPHLDGGYTVFGRIIRGLDVIDKISSVETDNNDRPREDVILTIDVDEMSRKKISKDYGYEYPVK